MNFMLYSTGCGWNIKDDLYYKHYDKIVKSNIKWYVKELNPYKNTKENQSVVFVTIETPEDFITLSNVLQEPLIIGEQHRTYYPYPVIEIYDYYRE